MGQTVRRIGSIGRTTIACITPANETRTGSSSTVDPMSAAALTAAGVELDDCMTEVIVKIENNSNASDVEGPEEEEEPEEMQHLRLMLPRKRTRNATEQDEEQEAECDEEYNNFALKISSPMSWAYDAVKIEPDEEDFEQMMCAAAAAAADADAEHDAEADEEPDNNTDEDDDDLLTTAAATSKQAASNAKGKAQKTTRGRNNPQQLQQQQQQQWLLQQQEHLHHLQLQPNQRSTLQMKFATIPATISKVTTNGGLAASSSTGNGQESNNNNSVSKGSEIKTGVSDGKGYRILIQNQRMRKESLEHSEDMIYNADIEKPWVCRNCNRNYKWKNSLKCHLKNECGQPPRYFCSKLCGYATNVHSNLKRHLNTKCRDRLDESEKQTSQAQAQHQFTATNVSACSTTYTMNLPKQE